MGRLSGAGLISSELVRQLLIGGVIVGVLLCTILGSSVLTLQEQGGQPVAVSTRTPTPSATHTPTGTASSPTTGPTSAPTATASPTMTPSPTATLLPGETPPTETATPTPAPTMTPTSVPTVSQVTAQPCGRPAGWQPYLVQPGDTLTSLALRSGTTVAAIMNANCLKATVIYAGQRLYLPRALTYPTQTPTSTPTKMPPTATPTQCVIDPPAGWVAYVVQAGDSLYDLALRHGTTIYEVRQVNCLSSDAISPGQQLYLPALPPTATPTWTLVPSSTLTAPAVTPTSTLTVEVTPSPTTEETPTPTIEVTSTPTDEATSTPTVEATPEPTEIATPEPTEAPTPTD